MTIEDHANNIIELTKQIDFYKDYKEKLKNTVKDLNEQYKQNLLTEEQYHSLLSKYLKNKSENEWIKYFNMHIAQLLEQINNHNTSIYESLTKEKKLPKTTLPQENIKLNKKLKEKYFKEINITQNEVKEFISLQKLKSKTKPKEVKYSIHGTNFYIILSNAVTRNFGVKIARRFPNLFKKLHFSLQQSGIKILTRSYISMVLFSALLALLLTPLITVVFYFNKPLLTLITRIILFTIIATALTLVAFYYYPFTVVDSKKRNIKNKIPFATIHMAAIAGSGAPPVKMFDLILKSGEYGELATEIKRIMNYVNLFGYNLSTALKAVAKTTPSYQFQELLNGITATIEGGGDLKNYLKEKAEDAMETYRQERKKFNEIITTLSDVYIGILIAAPILFIIPLAIINAVGGTIFGLNAVLLSNIGIYGLIPILNIAFILFINITQPEK